MLLEFAAASCCCPGSSRVRLVSPAGAPGPHEVISGTFPVEPTPAQSAQPGVGNCLGTPTPRGTVTPRRLAFDGPEDAASLLACELDYPPGFEPTSGARSSRRETTARPPLSTTTTFSDAFSKSVLRKLEPPLVPVPPQPPSPRPPRTCQSRRRSRRLATQPLARVPTSKRGEVLIMQRMGYIKPGQPPTAAAIERLDRLLGGDMSASEAKALDALFLAVQTRRRRRKAAS